MKVRQNRSKIFFCSPEAFVSGHRKKKRGILTCLLFCFLFTHIAKALPKGLPYVFVKNYTVDDYQASCQNWGLSLTPNGMLYAANNSGLLSFDGNTWKLYALPNTIEISSVTFYKDTIYTCNDSLMGGWTYDAYGDLHYHPLEALPLEVRFSSPSIQIPFDIPAQIQEAQPSSFATNGSLFFIGTLTQGLYILSPDGTILQHLSMQNQLQDNIVRSISVQNPQQIWVALDNGLSQITFEPPLTLLEKRSTIGKLLNACLSDNNLYIQTTLGYFKCSLSTGAPFQPISQTEATPYLNGNADNPHLSIHQVFTDTESLGTFVQARTVYPAGDNQYWLTNGNEAGLFHVADGKGTLICRLLFGNYNMHLVTKGRQIIQLNDSLVLAATMQGALLVNLRELIGNSLHTNVPLNITKLEYTDASGIHQLPIDTKKISLPHNFQEFKIWVGTSIFTSNHQISYKIEGISSDWSAWQQDGKISFLQIPEGQYELKIRKYAIKGPYPELSLYIEVRPAWYNTMTAWLLYLVLGWLSIHLLFRFYKKKLQREELKKAESERQIELQRVQEIKNQELEAELQNKNNELTLQTTILVKRNQAIQNLLDELKQQKEALGDRYSNKLYNRLKTLLEETLNDQADWTLFESYFNSTHQNFVNRLRQKYADITPGDIRICCLLRMNLSTKEIASLMNVSIRAIELRRYRLRKRLGLEGEINLVDFLINF